MPISSPSPSSSSPLAALDLRSREIFKRIVDCYLETGEPVGSRQLTARLPMALSPASVRAVMQELEKIGLLYAPHVSAGRLPTQTGLRFFVDALLDIGDVAQTDRSKIEAQINTAARAMPLEGLLGETSALLSGLTHSAGVVVTSKDTMRLRHIEFVRLEETRGLVVLVGQDGSVENRVIDLPAGLPASSLVEAANYLSAMLSGQTVSEARGAIEQALARAEQEVDTLTARLIETGLACWADFTDGKKQLIVRGQANLLENLPALEDLERVRLLFADLETQKDVIDLLNRVETGEGVRIFIGAENNLFSLSGSSMIAAPFKGEDNRIIGVLGVIGPTRLNYARIIPMVGYTAAMVGAVVKGKGGGIGEKN